MSSLANAVPRTDATRRFISLQRRQSLVGIAFVLPAVAFFALFNFYAWGMHSISASRAGIFLRHRSGSVLQITPVWSATRTFCRRWASRFATLLNQLSR